MAQSVVVRRPVVRWAPAREVTDLNRQFAQLVQSVFAPYGPATGPARPVSEITEGEDAYTVALEVPGFPAESIAVEVTGRTLAVTGELKDEEGAPRTGTRRSTFEYRATLPAGVTAEAVTAELVDGVLTVSVPKPAAAKPHRVEIAAR